MVSERIYSSTRPLIGSRISIEIEEMTLGIPIIRIKMNLMNIIGQRLHRRKIIAVNE